jgi:hypothetical protein
MNSPLDAAKLSNPPQGAVPPRIAAVVGHADAADLLASWIGYHLSIGVDYIFISVNRSDPETRQVLESVADDPRIRAAAVEDFARDGFDYFSEAAREVVAWCAPDWILFCDTDEFCVPQSGRINELAGLAEHDVLVIDRYNTPPIIRRDGGVRTPDFANPHELPIIAAREEVEEQFRAGRPRTPWIMARDAPKLMARVEAIEKVGPGGHTVLARRPDLRSALAQDALMVHAPFTSEARFRRKLDSVREIFARVGDRFHSREAWHWRYWLSLPESELGAEFRRQAIKESATPMLIAQGVLTTPAEHLRGERQQARAESPGVELSEALRRVVLYPRRQSSGMGESMATETTPSAALKPMAQLRVASPRRVARPDECYFYHTIDIPNAGLFKGQWDLRGAEAPYLGNAPLAGRSVFEIGTASGYLAFWMERQGANVTSFDLDENQDWDLVPFAGLDLEQERLKRKAIIKLINNSWHFAHERMESKARCIYGTVYALDGLAETFDIVVLSSVLLHLRNPLLALERAAALSRDTLIVTEVADARTVPHEPSSQALGLYFVPRLAQQGPIDCWWGLPERTTAEFLKILGFPNIEATHHKQRFMDGGLWDYYTLVARRA